jgi:aryl-alcohol dehydrogenase-like predicted oxidoreductase
MDYRNLGRAGVKVSSLCLGCMNFGGPTDEDEATSIIHKALDAGINFIDTANVYNKGESEKIVGKALAGRCDEVVLATKVHGRMGDGPNDRGNSRYHIMQQVEASLKRLQTDHIDLYQLHRPDPDTPMDEQLSALTDLVRQGKVRYLGTSTFPSCSLSESLWVSETHNFERFVCEQPPYNILCRRIEDDILPFCRKHGFAVIPWSPLAGGWLTGKYRRDEEAPADSRARQHGWDLGSGAAKQRLDVIEKLFDVVENQGKPGGTMSQFALAWLLHQPGVTAPIIGPRTCEQLDDNLHALDITLSDEALQRVDDAVECGCDLMGYC